MPLSAADRALLHRCLNREGDGWIAFVDRFLGLIFHVVQHTGQRQGIELRPEDSEDVAAEVLMQFVKNDFAVLRQFRGHCTLATYLTVIARRICLRELSRRLEARVPPPHAGPSPRRPREAPPEVLAELETREEMEKLLHQLPAPERHVVRLYYLEGRTYEEISQELHIPVNSIGPMLSRSRQKLRSNTSNPAQARRH